MYTGFCKEENDWYCQLVRVAWENGNPVVSYSLKYPLLELRVTEKDYLIFTCDIPDNTAASSHDGYIEPTTMIRLTENDERLYACAKRLEAVERRQDALDKLVTAVEVLAVRQESVEGNVKEIRNAVQSITEKPGKRWEALADRVLYLLLGAVFSLLAQGAAA